MKHLHASKLPRLSAQASWKSVFCLSKCGQCISASGLCPALVTPKVQIHNASCTLMIDAVSHRLSHADCAMLIAKSLCMLCLTLATCEKAVLSVLACSIGYSALSR